MLGFFSFEIEFGIMKFRKGNLVEVLRREHDPCGSWFPGNIVSVEGNDYVVRYKFLLDEEGEPLLEKVHWVYVRPLPLPLPLHEVAKRWRVGDIAEVFDNQCWRVGKIAKVLPKNGFVIRLFGSIQLKEFHESNIRIRKSSHINQWSVTGKVKIHAIIFVIQHCVPSGITCDCSFVYCWFAIVFYFN